MAVRDRGTNKSLDDDERSWRRSGMPASGRQRSLKYAGARPWMHFHTSTAILKSIRSLTGSQWSSLKTGILSRSATLLCAGSRYSSHTTGNSHTSGSKRWLKNVNDTFHVFVHGLSSIVKFRCDVSFYRKYKYGICDNGCNSSTGIEKFQGLYRCFLLLG